MHNLFDLLATAKRPVRKGLVGGNTLTSTSSGTYEMQRICAILLPLLLIAWAAPPLQAQVATFYSFQQTNESFAYITGGTRLNATLNSFDDQVYTVTIPEFFFDGAFRTTMFVSANGFITFGAAPSGGNYTPLSSSAGYAGAISAFGCNLVNAGSGTREIRWQQVGNEVVVQWRGARRSGVSGETFDFQIRLNTANGEVVMRYNASSPASDTSPYPQVGLRGPNNTFSTNVNNRRVDTNSGAGSTWANTAAGTNNASECRYNNQLPGRSPVDGQTYRWTPACLPLAASATVVPDCATNTFSIHVSITSLGSAGSVAIQAPVGTTVVASAGIGTHVVGPFPIGQSRPLRLVHPSSSLCNLDLGTFSSSVTCVNAGQCYGASDFTFGSNSCPNGSSVLRAGILVSGLNSELGSTVDLNSLDLIIAHGSRGQVRVTLTSPSGDTYAMITNRGGTNSNFGNPSSCPSSIFSLDDNAASPVSSMPSSNNTTGSRRPEQPLSSFTGDPNGLWTLTICSSGGTAGSLRLARLNFCDRPGVATGQVVTSCSSNSFSVNVDISDIGNAASVDIVATPGGTLLTGLGVGVHTVGPFSIGSTVQLSLAAAGTCTRSIGSFQASGTCYTNATCVNPGPAFAGNSCWDGSIVEARIPVSGQPNALGSNVVLQRVQLIIAHTARQQVRVELISPDGQARAMFSNVGGNSRSNFGNPSSCPSAAFILDDAAAQPVANVPTGSGNNNVTGSWRPEFSLGGFTGNPNGDWVLRICSSGGTGGNLRFANLVFAPLDCEGTPNGPATAGTACDDGDPYTVNDQWNAECDCVGEPGTLYSLGSGNFSSGNNWSFTPGGAPAGLVPGAGSDLVIESGHIIELNGSRSVRNLTIAAGGTLQLGTGMLTVHGTNITVHGTLSGNTGTLAVDGSELAILQGSAVPNLFNLTVNNSAGLTVNSNIQVRNTLQLNAGVFTAVGEVKLRSTATRTARLGAVAAGASYVGNLTMERHIPGGATNWRLFGSPVQNATVADWNDDFYTAGFPGSNYPNFFSGGVLWPSVRWYDETMTGGANAGLVGVSGTNHALQPGRGFAVWSGDALGGTNAFTVDVAGPPTIAQSPMQLPMSWTNTGNAAADGWNLVSNPLPSPINFTTISRGADVQNAYWIFNPATGNNASWVNGLSTLGATGIIQSSQGFWMKATGPQVTTTVSEATKSANGSGGIFGGQEQLVVPMVRLALSSALNSYRDEALVAFHEGSPGVDASDARKYVFAHPQAPQISVLSSDGVPLAISAHGEITAPLEIPVLVDVAVTGTYTITASDMLQLNGSACLTLEDLGNGAIIPLVEGASYNFTVNANADASAPRFMLRTSAPVQLAVTEVLCNGGSSGAAMMQVPFNADRISWMNAAGVVLAEQQGGVSEATIDGLQAGSYTVTVEGGNACGTLTRSFVVVEPFALEADVFASPALCADQASGSIWLEVRGGIAPMTYLWSNGATTDRVDDMVPGIHNVRVTDANGCTLQVNDLVVTGPEPIEAALEAPPSVAYGEAVQLSSSAANGVVHLWAFGDGGTSTERDPVHTYTEPGEYAVTLTLVDGPCQRALEHTISVFVTTGVVDAEEQVGMQAWPMEGGIMVAADVRSAGEVRIFDSAGRLVRTQQWIAGAERSLVPMGAEAFGIYHVELRGEGYRWSTSVAVEVR